MAEGIGDGQDADKSHIEDQLLRERERDCRKRAVQMALVMFQMDPMERAQVKGAVRSIMPNFGPDRRRDQRQSERCPTRALEETKIQEGRQDHRVDRRRQGVFQLPLDLIFLEWNVVYRTIADFPV